MSKGQSAWPRAPMANYPTHRGRELEDVQAYPALIINVGMVDGGVEGDLGWLKGKAVRLAVG